MATGTVNQAPLYPREILKRALEIGATRADHRAQPSIGRSDPVPGRREGDRLTSSSAARPLEIAVHDHLIVARTGWRSLRAEGLI